MGADTSQERRDHSVGDLVKQLSTETSTLIRQEMALARAELSEQGRKAGAGAGMFGGAGLLGLGAFGALTACLILALDTAMDSWLAALIVTLVYAAVAGVLALRGRNKIKDAGTPAEQTIETVKEDIRWVKTQK